MEASSISVSDSAFNKIVNSDVFKLEDFDGTNFTHWKANDHFCLLNWVLHIC